MDCADCVSWISTTNASPILYFQANYWNGSASAQDSWYFQQVLGAGTNGTSYLELSHGGTLGADFLIVPNILSQAVVNATTSVTAGTSVSANNGAFNSTTGITINPAGANGTTLNYNSGTGGVAFANGAGGIKAAIDSNGTLWLGGAANSAGIAQIAHAPAITVSGIAATNLGIADSSSIWTFALDNSGNLGIAGGIYTDAASGSGSNITGLQFNNTTVTAGPSLRNNGANGYLTVNAGGGNALYLNWDSGSGGINIGAGGQSSVAQINAAGKISIIDNQGTAGATGVAACFFANAYTGRTAAFNTGVVYTSSVAGFYRCSATIHSTTASSTSWVLYPIVTVTQNGAINATTQTIGSEIDIHNNSVATNQTPGMYYVAAGAQFAFTFNTLSGSNTDGVFTVA